MADLGRSVSDWLAAARAGSSEALGKLLEAFRGYLLVIARAELAPDLQAKRGASDLVQDTFKDAQRDFSQFVGSTEDELRAWLRRILLNRLATFASSFRETSKRQVDLEVSLDAGSGNLKDGLVADTPSPSDQVIADEQAAAVERALGRLPEKYRQVLVARYYEERSWQAIADEMKRSPKTARRLWAEAIALLQAELKTLP